jgi:hypothetical protein
MKFVGAVILWVVVLSISMVGQARADWVKGYFAPTAGVDSINRCAVVQDYRDSTVLGRRLVRAGDINGDGIGDFIACRLPLFTIDDTSLLFLGGRPPSSDYSQLFANFNGSLSNIGDINGDGSDDFGRLRNHIAPMRYEVFRGGSILSDTAWAYFPGVPWFTLGTRVADLDGDGKLDLALVTSVDSHSVKIFSVEPVIDTIPKYVIRDTARNFGDNLVVGDFNGDGFPDLAIAASLNRYVSPPFVKFYWGGPNFDTIADMTISNPSEPFGIILESLGDLNGDGFDDIVICGGSNDPYGVYFGRPNIDDKLDVNLSLWRGGHFYLPPTSVSGGDFNHDGRQDVVLSYQDPNSFSSSFFEIFLGGPHIDSLAEAQIFAADIGGPLWDFGRNIYGISDFNGDGIDDFVIPTLSDNGCC